MNIGKVAIYSKYGNYHQLISDKPIVYCYAKDLESLNHQKSLIDSFCKKTLKKPKEFYLDYGVSNFLKNKKDLNKLLLSNSNVDVLVLSQDRLTRDHLEMLQISSLCREKHINFFGIKENNLLMQNDYDKTLLDHINKIKNDDLEI